MSSLYVRTTAHANQYRTPTKSPIASKQQRTVTSPKKTGRSIVRNLMQRFDDACSPKSSKKKSLFSPKYTDTTQHVSDANQLNSPPASPLKKRERMDSDCMESVQSMKQSLWSSVEEEMDSFLFMKYAPKLPANYHDGRKPVLPPPADKENRRFTLVLDLDETLVHCDVNKVAECDQVFPVVFGGETYQVYMSKRPFFQRFLELMAPLFEVVVFTASQQCYADKLLDLVDPEKRLIHHRLFRHHCVNVEGNFVKDLRVRGRDLATTVIVDNSPPAFTFQLDNGIPIVSWYSDRHDNELQKLIPLLMKLRTLNDVRPALKKYFRMKQLVKSVKM